MPVSSEATASMFDADASGDATRVLQDEAARRVLVVLQGKDADIRRLEADVAEGNNALRDLQAELAEMRAERGALKEQLQGVVAGNYTDGVAAEKLKAEVAFLEHEREALADEKQAVVLKLRSELDASQALRQEVQEGALQRITMQRQIDELNDAAAYHASMVDNLQQQLELEKEEGVDRTAELSSQRENAATERASLADQLRSVQAQTVAARQKAEGHLRDQRSLQAKLDRAGAEALSLRDSIDELKAQASAETARVEEKEQELDDLKEEVKRVTARAESQRASFDAKVAEHQSALEALGALKANAEQIEAELREAQAENVRHRENMAQRDVERREKQQRLVELDALRQDNDVLRSKLADSVQREAVLERQVSVTQSNYTTKCAELGEAHTAISTLSAEQAHLKEHNATTVLLEAEVASLGKRLQAEQRRAAEISDAAQRTQHELFELHKTFSDHQSAARAMNDDFQHQLETRDATAQEQAHVIDGLREQVDGLDGALAEEREAAAEEHSELLQARREVERLTALMMKVKKERKKAKQASLLRDENEEALREEVKRQSEHAVSEMRAQQDLVSALTSARDELARRLAAMEDRCTEAEAARAGEVVALREELAAWQEKCSASDAAAAAADAVAEKALTSERKKRGDVAAKLAAAQDSIAGQEKAAAALHMDVKNATQRAEDAEAKVAKLKSIATRQDNRIRAMETKLEASQLAGISHSQMAERDREQAAIHRRSADEDKRRHQLIVELRTDKSRLSAALAEANDRARQAEDRVKLLQCTTSRTSKLLAQYRSHGAAGDAASTSPSHASTPTAMKKEDVEAAKEWQQYVVAQLTTLSEFLVRSTLETIETIDSLRQTKGGGVDAPFGMFDAATSQALHDTTLLTPTHYHNAIRLALGYTKGCLATVPTLKVAGGLGEGGARKPQELAAVLTELVLRRVKLEADLASLTAL